LKGKARDTLAEERARRIEEQFLGNFVKSYSKIYDRWKRKDLLLVALQTLPKQVDKKTVIDNLLKLETEYSKKLNDEG